ncbi:lipopolysaccharide biosynthesis protein [Brytella acorum]|uniref:Polysaccharide biosynthesis C-terminal domain-containing protein n=1 Tax=Brytella acorum TaxID=2959299 RepID=A0AA35UF17_9PROT|nr:polysaccharide biosynthesis C-terminal domain-containing protein [Brytella acorum]MDF3623686.1 polysaccharide biosynthesis C-terminal domain-containing protein [Brytella acorum]CAI9119896.1 polysaccharide biosynthesis C-terminal domain-containing protein [Brytella acorum]
MKNRAKTPFSRIIGNTSVLLTGRILNAICSFIYIPWTVRTLGLDGFGVMLLVTVYATLIADLTHLQSWQPLLHYGTSSFRQGRDRFFYNVLAFAVRADYLSGILGLVIGLVGIFAFGDMMGWPREIRPTAAWCMITLLFMNMSWSIGVMRLLNRFKLSTTFEFVATMVRTLGSFIGYELHCGVKFFIVMWCVSQVVQFICNTTMGIILVRRNVSSPFPWKELFLPSAPIPGAWKLMLGTSASQAIVSLLRPISTLIVGARLGAADAAIFRVAMQVTSALAKPATVLLPAMYPEFVRLRDEEDWSGLRATIFRILKAVGLFSVAVILVALLFGGPILDFMLHRHSAGGGVLIGILALSAMIDISIIPFEPLLTVIGHVGYVLRCKVATLVIDVPLLFAAMYLWGIDGAAIGSVVASMILFGLLGGRAAKLLFGRHDGAAMTAPVRRI